MKDLKSTGTTPVELTRREWLLKLGEAAVLLGFTGCATDTTAEVTASLPASDVAQLPPGLYEPSSEHLGHALTLDSLFHPVPPGSETDYVRPRNGPFEPQSFAPDEFKVVRRVVELMLGEARTSSKRDVQDHDEAEISQAVAEWIDLSVSSASAVRDAAQRLAPEHRLLAVAFYGAEAVKQLEIWDPEAVSKEGLRWVKEESEGQYGATFLKLQEAQQIALLRQLSESGKDNRAQNAGTRFFHLIKSEVIRGFYTSQAGLKELGYKGNAFYAESPGCVRHQH